MNEVSKSGCPPRYPLSFWNRPKPHPRPVISEGSSDNSNGQPLRRGWDSLTNSTGVTWKHIKNDPGPNESESLGGGGSDLCFHKPSK